MDLKRPLAYPSCALFQLCHVRGLGTFLLSPEDCSFSEAFNPQPLHSLLLFDVK